MSVVATALRELVALGVSGEALVSAIERIEQAAVEERATTVREAVEITTARADADLKDEGPLERRRRLDRERKRRQRGHSADIPQTSAETADIPPPLEQKDPTPQKTQTPSPSKNPPMGVKKVPASRRCPDQWAPSEAVLHFGEAEGFSPGEIERELSKFRDHTFPTTRSDWNATFRNWLRIAAERKPRQAHERPNPDPKFDARQANLARAFAGSESAARRRWEP